MEALVSAVREAGVRDGRVLGAIAAVCPLGPGGAEEVVLFEKQDGELHRIRSITGAHFVRLRGAHGFP